MNKIFFLYIALTIHSVMTATEMSNVEKELVKNKMAATQDEIKATHALIAAVGQKKYDEAEAALKAGARLDGLGFSDPVILLAIHNSDERMVRLLLEYKADVNCDVDRYLISTPLMQSTMFSTPAIFKLILDQKSDVRYKAHLLFGRETVLCCLVTPHIGYRFSEADRKSCIAQVMERSEIDDSDIEFVSNYIRDTQLGTVAHDWTQDQRANAQKFLDYARDCKGKRKAVASEKLAESDELPAGDNGDSGSWCVVS